MSRIFLSAGESSGDLHGSNLVRALIAADPSVECEGLGGPLMESAGMRLVHDMTGCHVMGFSEVARALLTIRRILLDTAAHLRNNPPDCLVLIDNPDFNLRLAAYAQKAGIPVVYYISPQVWAWRKGRIHTIVRLVRKMLVILPFEEELYHQVGVDALFVGHPLLDHVTTSLNASMDGPPETGIIGLLPGSREQEVARLLPIMIDVARGIRERYPRVRFLVPCVSEERRAQVQSLMGDFPLEIAVGNMHEVLRQARFCLVASGTATLETALFEVPMAILYKTAPLNYWIARLLVRIEHIGLANILAGRGIVPEFIQDDACVARILPVALELYENTPRRKQALRDLAEVRRRLGTPGASVRAAQAILDVVKGRHG